MFARFRLPLLVVALAALPALPAAVSAKPTRTPQVATADAAPGYHGVLQRRPKLIVYSGDGAAYIGGAHRRPRGSSPIVWSSWGSKAADGTGADWLDDCTPNCAQGHYTAYPAKIRLDRPKRLGGHLVFSRLTLTFTAARPDPARRRLVMTLRYSSRASTYIW